MLYRYGCLILLVLWAASCSLVRVEKGPSRVSAREVSLYMADLDEWRSAAEPSPRRFASLAKEGRSLFSKGDILSPDAAAALKKRSVRVDGKSSRSYVLMDRRTGGWNYRLSLRTDSQGKVLSDLSAAYPDFSSQCSSEDLYTFLRHVIRGETDAAAQKGNFLFRAGTLLPPDYSQKMGQYLKSRKKTTLEYVFYRTKFQGLGKECKMLVDERNSRVLSFQVIPLGDE